MAHAAAGPAGYAAGMFGNMARAPVQSLPLTVVTAQLIVQGTIQTRLRRLTDILNEPDIAHLVVLDATFMEAGIEARGRREPRLRRFSWRTSCSPTRAGRPNRDSEMRMPKQAVPATLLAPPFTIEGQIHLAYESELKLPGGVRAIDSCQSPALATGPTAWPSRPTTWICSS